MYKINDIIKIKNSNLYGKIIYINQNNACININNKKTNIDIDKIELVQDKQILNNFTLPKNVNVNFIISNDKTFNHELMLRHQKYDEALDNVEKFINEALSKNVKIIKIIHGKNGGILRKMVHEYLTNCEFVQDFRLGYPHEGSYGVTICKLK